MGLNCWTGVGRLVADPELKYTPSGVPVCTVRIAVDRDFKSGDERETDFLDVVLWRQSAEFAANYLGKGRLVSVQGRIQVRKWTDKDDNRRQSVEIVADRIHGLDRAKDGEGSNQGQRDEDRTPPRGGGSGGGASPPTEDEGEYPDPFAD